jgi:hypothetical protein
MELCLERYYYTRNIKLEMVEAFTSKGKKSYIKN